MRIKILVSIIISVLLCAGRGGVVSACGGDMMCCENGSRQISKYIEKVDVYGEPIPESRLFWYNTLSKDEQGLYWDIHCNASTLKTDIPINGKISTDRTLDVLNAVRYDNPELFWLDYSIVTYYYTPDEALSVEICFHPEVSLIPQHISRFEAITDEVLNTVKVLKTDMEQVKYIHDLLVKSNTYDAGAEYDQTSYSAVVTGKSVCMGYSLAFLFYMQRLGIPCTLLFDDSGDETHVWNLVEIDGAYYNVDVTGDNPSNRPKDTVYYRYFCITDEEMAKDYVRTGVSATFPPAETRDWK